MEENPYRASDVPLDEAATGPLRDDLRWLRKIAGLAFLLIAVAPGGLALFLINQEFLKLIPLDYSLLSVGFGETEISARGCLFVASCIALLPMAVGLRLTYSAHKRRTKPA